MRVVRRSTEISHTMTPPLLEVWWGAALLREPAAPPAQFGRSPLNSTYCSSNGDLYQLHTATTHAPISSRSSIEPSARVSKTPSVAYDRPKPHNSLQPIPRNTKSLHLVTNFPNLPLQKAPSLPTPSSYAFLTPPNSPSAASGPPK